MTNEQKAKKLAEGMGLSEEEALELTNLLLSQEFVEDQSFSDDTPDLATENDVNQDEMDAINQDFDTQMAHDAGDVDGMQSASQGLATSLAKLRSKRAKKTAEGLAPEDPRKQELDRAVNEVYQEEAANPDVTPETLQYALVETQAMVDQMPGQPDPEELKLLIRNHMGVDPQNRLARMIAANSEPRFGVPEEEGKLYRSWVNPAYFKSAKGNIYKLSYQPVGTEESSIPGSPAPEEPASPAPEGQIQVSQQEIDACKQLMADAQANGRSHSFLAGILSGFSGDQKLKALAGSSETEANEFEQGRLAAQKAKGNSSEPAAPAAPAMAPTGV